MKIENGIKVTVDTAAVEVAINYRSFVLMNNSDATIYFQSDEIKPVTPDTGMALPGKTAFPFKMTCQTLSLCASAAGGEVRVLYVD